MDDKVRNYILEKLKNDISNEKQVYQDNQSRNNVMAGIDRIVSGIGGVQSNQDFYNNLNKQNFRNMQSNIETAKDSAVLDQKAELDDPTSERSVNVRNAYKAVAPGLVQKFPNFESLSAKDIQENLKTPINLYQKGLELDRVSLEKQNKLDRETRKDKRDFTKTLRQEYNSNPIVKDTIDIQQSFGKIEKSAKDNSAAGDLALIFNYMKMLDPGSTVREGEFANAQNSGSVPQIVLAKYNQILSGERLSADQRKDFLSQSRNILNSQYDQFYSVNKRYQELSEQYEIDPKNVLMNPYKFSDESQNKKASASDPGRVTVSNGEVTLSIPKEDLAEAMEDGYKEVK